MSWKIFKSNIKRRVQKPETLQKIDDIVDLYTNEYDRAIRRGRDTINKTTLLRGNTSAFRATLKFSLQAAQRSNSPTFSLVNEFGKSVIAYWTGATLSNLPLPIIPAAGAIQNVAITSNTVVNPGIWPTLPPIPPSQTSDVFLDNLVLASTLHLLTITGTISTISLYPGPISPITAPGIVPWTGFTV